MTMQPRKDGKLSTRFVEVKGRRLRVGERRNGSGRPLLLFNGFGVPLEMLNDFVSAIERTHVIAFDIPGMGKSPPPRLPYRLSQMARLSARLLDQLGHHEVDIMGVSWGGGLAQQFVRDFPDRCHRLILAATSAGAVMVPGKPRVALKMVSPASFTDPVRLRRLMSDIQGGGGSINTPFVPKPLTKMNAHDLRGHVFQALSVWGWTSIHWLHRVRQPTLVLSGEDDPLVPPINGKILACRIPNATERTFRGGHLFMMVCRDMVANTVEEFLREEGEFAHARQ